MSDVKWIKITTDIFDDEKILLIESLPESDSIIVIWFKLLALAGKQNNNGVFLMSNRIPYTEDMLSAIFRRNLNTVRLALQTFVQFGMVEIIDNVITIPNWDKHQSLDSYEKKKERDRLYQQNRRAVQKALIEGKSSDKSSDIAVSDKEEEIYKDNNIGAKSAQPVPVEGEISPEYQETGQDTTQDAPKGRKRLNLSVPELKSLFKAYTNDPVVIDLLLEWCDIRKVKGGVNTKTAIASNLKKMDQMASESSLTVPEYLEEVIAKAWLAFYPIRNGRQGSPSGANNAPAAFQFPPLQTPMRVFDSSRDEY